MGGKLNFNGTLISISCPTNGGKGVAQGSFATKHAALNLNLSVPYVQWVSACQSSSGLATMMVISTSFATL